MPVLLFAFGVSFLTGLAFGIGPAWVATRVDPNEALQSGSRSIARDNSLSRKTLVVFQAAFSLVLLSAAGLLVAALQRLENQNFGFEQNRRAIVTMDPRSAGYRPAQLPQLYRRIRDSMASVPGVSSVALCQYSPLRGGGWGSGVWVDGRPAPGPRDDNSSLWNRVTSGYFETIGTPITAGRGVTELDTASSRQVAIVNEAFARKFFQSEDPIGKFFGKTPDNSRQFEVVGVVKDARYLTSELGQSVLPMFFLPEAQAEYSQGNLGSLFLHDIVILEQPGASLSDAQVREALASVDPDLPIISFRSLHDQVATQFAQQRLIARLTSLFGTLSLVLASIGLYGVTAYSAAQRTNEIGLRMALGAGRGDAVRLVLQGAFLLVTMGLALGIPLSLAASGLLSSQLYGLSPHNPGVIASSVAVLAVFALSAALIPAFRASSISPSAALRAE